VVFLSSIGIIAVSPPSPISAGSNCSPPVVYEDNPRYLLERCSDGTYVIDREDGSKEFVNPKSCRAGSVILADC
jgi:hypothetical protein